MLLRLVAPDDAAAVAAIYAPIVLETAISFEEIPPDIASMRARISAHPPDKAWIVAQDDDGTIAGYAYASVWRARPAYRFGAELTVYVAETARRRGIGRTLYEALLQLMAAQGYRRAFAGVTLPNDASVALHKAIGMAEAGTFRAAGFKFNRWHDLLFLEKTIGPLDTPHHDPIAVAALAPDTVDRALSA